MKIGVFSVPEVALGKRNVKDRRLDEVDKITKAKKKTYIQIELTGEDSLLDTDAIIAKKDNVVDLVLKDMEFVETRLSRCTEEKEKNVLVKIRVALEKEEFVFKLPLTPEEKELITNYGLFTARPVIIASEQDLENQDDLLSRAVKEAGYISFFTTGEKETRAWLIRQGINAWEASGTIHSDIQRGFIRAEIISFDDFIKLGGETAAKQAGKMRLENKEYIMQDTDLVNFRFNK